MEFFNLKIRYETQIQNACLAVAALKHMQINPSGLQEFYWPCRMELFEYDDRRKLILDGCHNGDSVTQFMSTLRQLYSNCEILVLLGVGSEKCVKDIIEPVVKYSDHILAVQSKHFKAMAELQLVELIQSFDQGDSRLNLSSRDFQSYQARLSTGSVASRLDEALEYAKQKSGSKPVIIAVCGSLFVAAEAREELFRLVDAVCVDIRVCIMTYL